MRRRKILNQNLLIFAALSGANQAIAAPLSYSLGTFGTPSIIEMPTGESMPDAEFTTALTVTPIAQRATFGFQITPRISGAFRYGSLVDFNTDGTDTFDRSFDLAFQLVREKKNIPAISIGLRDFLGTGLYSGQYIAATKNVGDKLKITGGIGWGRFGGINQRQLIGGQGQGKGGTPRFDLFFSGPARPFAGIEWQTPVKNLRLKAEYSSDRYSLESTFVVSPYNIRSPINIGLEWTNKSDVTFGLYYLYGRSVALRFNTVLNPNRATVPGGLDGAPLPVAVRPPVRDLTTDWLQIPGINARAREQLNTLLNDDGIKVEALELRGNRVELRIQNNRYLIASNAVGRVARAMAFVFPDSVETFVITPVDSGLPLASVILKRSDLEELEFHPDGVLESARRAKIESPEPLGPDAEFEPGLYPNLTYRFAPYVEISVFDSDQPVDASAGLRFSADYDIAPGLSVSGRVTARAVGTPVTNVPTDSVLPKVRTESALYRSQGNPAVDYLTADYLFKLSPDVYGRFSAGYLESMFGGVQAELLWKPADQRWGVGAEIAYARKRSYNQLFGFQNYNVVTGHVSAYYHARNGFDYRLDVGRYLAGDVGATFAIDRTFGNGWRVGAYATLTNVSFADFGEGSFDKGIRLSIPWSFISGRPDTSIVDTRLASLQRDGGARLDIRNRLYPMIRDYHSHKMAKTWGRFWR